MHQAIGSIVKSASPLDDKFQAFFRQCLVSRLTGQVDPSTHLPGNGMLCSGSSFSMESMLLALAYRGFRAMKSPYTKFPEV